ncbi:Abi family protein [Curtobacterium pusillum]|uniref:Abi family protein n=1 Tax=Curtobacterium pusillum TaxID=69373 RepID=UPI001643D47A|nr:Abi family protein [Curtobacterium pusillum]
MPDTTVPTSRYRTAQFRQALRDRGLDHSGASVRRLHEFDSTLRSVSLGLSERIELALRGHLDAAGAARSGSHWYLDRRVFRDAFDHRALLRHARAALDRTADPAIASAWRERRLERVPFGMLAEELSLGELSRLTGGLEPGLRDEIADAFQLPPPTLRPCLQHLTHVRNCCAHHTRLWGRRFRVPPPTFRSPPDLVARLDGLPKRTPAHSLELLAHLAETVGPCDRHAAAVRHLLDEHDHLVVGIGGRPTWAAT